MADCDVLFVALGLDVSGGSRHIVNLSTGLQRRNLKVAVATGELATGAPLGEELFDSHGITP